MSEGAKGFKMSSVVIAAIIGGVFAVAAALVGVFFKTGLQSNGGEASGSKGACEISMSDLSLNLEINGKSSSVKENGMIEATDGDSLLLVDLEVDLLLNGACAGTKLAMEAYLRKPEVRNDDPKDEFAYEDGRFTNGARLRGAFRSSKFFSKSGSSEWVLEDGWNNLALSLVEYSPRYPEGHVVERFYFQILRRE